MRKSGGAVIHMQLSLINSENIAVLDGIRFLVGDKESFAEIENVKPRLPFDEEVVEFLNSLSKVLMSDPASRAYGDVVTLGFWIRKASVLKLKETYDKNDGNIHVGRGLLFHVAPSNVPVNYAYSLFTGLLTGNANIVRIPSKDFEQVTIINRAINKTLEDYPSMRNYIYLVRYSKDQSVNDLLSALCNVRIIWGGDNTINEIRKSPLAPRAGEVTFADRYSLAVIDSDYYLNLENKDKVANDFYNDTYLTDQNACTSPRIVVWTGNSIEKAKEVFWSKLHELVKNKYTFQPIMGVNKLTESLIYAATHEGVKIEERDDNFIYRIKVDSVDDTLMDFKSNTGYFFEYDCKDIKEIGPLCDNTRCQTLGYLAEKEALMPLLTMGLKGIDRVVPVGKTMDFDFIWDGYDLSERLTRTISIK